MENFRLGLVNGQSETKILHNFSTSLLKASYSVEKFYVENVSSKTNRFNYKFDRLRWFYE